MKAYIDSQIKLAENVIEMMNKITHSYPKLFPINKDDVLNRQALDNDIKAFIYYIYIDVTMLDSIDTAILSLIGDKSFIERECLNRCNEFEDGKAPHIFKHALMFDYVLSKNESVREELQSLYFGYRFENDFVQLPYDIKWSSNFFRYIFFNLGIAVLMSNSNNINRKIISYNYIIFNIDHYIIRYFNDHKSSNVEYLANEYTKEKPLIFYLGISDLCYQAYGIIEKLWEDNSTLNVFNSKELSELYEEPKFWIPRKDIGYIIKKINNIYNIKSLFTGHSIEGELCDSYIDRAYKYNYKSNNDNIFGNFIPGLIRVACHSEKNLQYIKTDIGFLYQKNPADSLLNFLKMLFCHIYTSQSSVEEAELEQYYLFIDKIEDYIRYGYKEYVASEYDNQDDDLHNSYDDDDDDDDDDCNDEYEPINHNKYYNEVLDIAKYINDNSQLLKLYYEPEPANPNKLVLYSLFQFLLYLSWADKLISDEEIDFISDVTYTKWSRNDLMHFVNKPSWIDPNDQIVGILRLAMIYNTPEEVALYSGDGVILDFHKKNTNISLELLDIYERLGTEFIACDNEVSESEITALTKVLTDFRNELMAKRIIKPSVNNADYSVKIRQKYNLHISPSTPTTQSDTPKQPSDFLNELNALTGLASVKEDVQKLINLLRVNKIRAERGMKSIPTSKHLVFSGNPGTGKTTVARILAKIYKSLGILSSGQLIEVDRSKLVAGYVGQTAIKTQELIDQAMGGILFIDEAYTLAPKNSSGNDFGQEAIDTILKAMEDNRDDLVVIVAGYPDLMQQFLNSNPGLRYRFNKFLLFEDYNPEELTSIFCGMCDSSGYTVNEDTKAYLNSIFTERYNSRSENFANGREVRNLFEMAVTNQANRLALDMNISDDELMELKKEDIPR